MHKSTRSSMYPVQDDELLNIDSQLDHVNKVLKWSIADLEKFTMSIKARLSAEEIYVATLSKITKSAQGTESSASTTNTTAGPIENNDFFGSYVTTFQQCTGQFKSSLDKTIELRRDYINCLKTQLDLLMKVKESHEQRRKKVKAVLGEKNMNYINFRTRDIVKLQKAYFNKCQEYSHLQQQIAASSSLAPHDDNNSELHHMSPQVMRISSEEPRVSSDSSRDDNNSIASSVTFQDPSSPPNHSHSKKSMSGFINQMKSQLANAAAAVDPNKQNTRIAKMKKEISDTDHEYRQGVRILEFLRKKQVETATHAMRHVEAILLGKYDAIKAVLSAVCKQEEDMLLGELDLVRHCLDAVNATDGKKDIEQYLVEYEKLGFSKPKTIYYDNFYYGRCKDILFGSNLNEYCMDHNRTVPLLVTKCIQSVEQQGGLEKEGIYRVSSRQSNIDALKNEFERDEDIVELSSKDVFTIASVLKIYLRELKQPIFNLSMQERIEYSKITDTEKRRYILESKLSELSRPQRDTLEAVIKHLAKVERNAKLNKMNMKNLSVIFTPALFHDHNQAENAGEWVTDKVFEDLIFHHEIVFRNAEIISSNKTEVSSQNSDSKSSVTTYSQSPPLPVHNFSPSSSSPINTTNSTIQDTSSIMSIPFSVGGIVSRKTSLSRRFTVLKSPASIPNIHNTPPNNFPDNNSATSATNN